jgi:hypothetical protein
MLVLYEHNPIPLVLLDFIEACETSELKFLSSNLLEHFGFTDEHRIDHAIHRAIQACIALKIPHTRHFRHIFIIRDNEITHDWKLSALGCYLTLLNEDPSHPLIARIQASLLGLR